MDRSTRATRKKIMLSELSAKFPGHAFMEALRPYTDSSCEPGRGGKLLAGLKEERGACRRSV
eukprot:scaffold92676_cov30-Tisochrysis_lutea.AAC.3